MKDGFSLTMPNGYKLCFYNPINPKQKSYDIMVNNGKDNNYYKVGILKDIDSMEKVFEWVENRK